MVDIWRLLRLTLVVFGLELAFVAGWWAGYRAAAPAERRPPGPADVIYSCPRHPAYWSMDPGECPADGGRLEPRRFDDAGGPGAREV
jgi:hypothetical protein